MDMRFLRVLAVCLFPLLISSAHADEVVTAEKAISGDAVALQDGRVLQLAGVKGALPSALPFLNSLVSDRRLVLQDAATDRYGRVVATAVPEGETKSVQDVLLRDGMVFVYPVLDDDRLNAWGEIERGARLSKRGFWAEHKDVPAQQAATLIGKFGFVAGVVSKAERIKNKVFLSFGAPEHPDLTIIVAARYLRPLKKQGIDVLSLEGKTVRVRGWVSEAPGPTITITTPYQIECFPIR
ncbi:MAG: thermonuclease family protein [Bdellovibrionales bacterium]